MSKRSALDLLRRASARLPFGPRLHVLGRFLSCPFLRVVDVLPPRGRVLDIGAGHGVFARLAAQGDTRQIVAVEPDLRKLGSVLRHPAVHWIAGYDDCVRGEFDAVVLCDVLYRVPLGDRDALLGRLVRRLKPGGLLALKEIDPDHRLKFCWNVVQEFLAIRVLRLTLGSGLAYENRGALADRLARAGLVDFRVQDVGRGYLHAHVLYTARRPA